MGSTRFPSKVIHPILGKPLVQWVVEGALQCAHAAKVIVATDDRAVADVVESAGHTAVMTREDHPSGTDRVHEAIQGINCDWVLNLFLVQLVSKY